jgi:hypothetical protein
MALPPTQRDILEAWEAELEEFKDRPLAMLIVATRIARDSKLIGREARSIALESNTASRSGSASRRRLPAATTIGHYVESVKKLRTRLRQVLNSALLAETLAVIVEARVPLLACAAGSSIVIVQQVAGTSSAVDTALWLLVVFVVVRFIRRK